MTKQRVISGFVVRQRDSSKALSFFVFVAPAKQILDWADIRRTIDHEGAAQRMLSTAHVRSITNYMRASKINIIPTAVTLAISPQRFTLEEWEVEGVTLPAGVSFGELTFSSKSADKPATVIDGQHRLVALKSQAVPLLVSMILGADDLERSLHFVVINNKAKRVPTDLVKAIISEMSESKRAKFEERLTSVGLTLGTYNSALQVLFETEGGPFYLLVDWDINRDGQRKIRPLALESALRVVMNDLETAADLEIDEGVQILSAIWKGIIAQWSSPPEWYDTKLADKAAFVAVTEFLVERLNYEVESGLDVTDVDHVAKRSEKIISSIPNEFWKLGWKEKSLDTTSGRMLIRRNLAQIRRSANAGDPDPLDSARDFLE